MPDGNDLIKMGLSVSLVKYFEEKFNSLDKASTVAYLAMEKRLESMNEFRDTLRDQASRFVTRSELDVIKERIDADIRVLREYKSSLEGKASQQSVNIALLMSAVGLLVGIVGLLKNWIK